MKLYIINHIIDGKVYTTGTTQSKDLAVRRVEAACNFLCGNDVEIAEKGNEIWCYYKGEPKYVIIECNLKLEVNLDGSVVEVGSDGR